MIATRAEIRAATVADLPRMEAVAREFYSASKHLREFHIARFVAVWTRLLALEEAAIFLCEVDGEIAGAISGLVHPDIYGYELIAEEFFWFIRPEARGAGVRLYFAFEKWAREKGAQWIQMVHLKDLMPEKVGRFYEQMGYEAIETRYEKRL